MESKDKNKYLLAKLLIKSVNFLQKINATQIFNIFLLTNLRNGSFFFNVWATTTIDHFKDW